MNQPSTNDTPISVRNLIKTYRIAAQKKNTNDRPSRLPMPSFGQVALIPDLRTEDNLSLNLLLYPSTTDVETSVRFTSLNI